MIPRASGGDGRETQGEGFTINIPLAKGHGDRDFAGIIYSLLNPLAQDYHPDIILVSCGFDLYMYDRLGEGIRECGLRVMQELCGVPTATRKRLDKIMGNSTKKLSAVKKVIEIQKKYWKILI